MYRISELTHDTQCKILQLEGSVCFLLKHISSQIHLKNTNITTRESTRVYPFQQEPTLLLSNYNPLTVISSFSGTK